MDCNEAMTSAIWSGSEYFALEENDSGNYTGTVLHAIIAFS